MPCACKCWQPESTNKAGALMHGLRWSITLDTNEPSHQITWLCILYGQKSWIIWVSSFMNLFHIYVKLTRTMKAVLGFIHYILPKLQDHYALEVLAVDLDCCLAELVQSIDHASRGIEWKNKICNPTHYHGPHMTSCDQHPVRWTSTFLPNSLTHRHTPKTLKCD